MRFAIRDDDTNFYTQPEEISYCYQHVWHICPPSLSVIPFVKGQWARWQAIFYDKGRIDDWRSWEADNKVYPIGENGALVDFLKGLHRERKIGITIHGVHHRNEDEQKTELSNNLIHYAEFYTSRDLSTELKSAREYLENLFGIDILAFTPPQNLMSLKGYDAVKANHLHLVGGGIPFLRRPKDLAWVRELTKVLSHKISHANAFYPHRLELGGSREYMVHYPLQEVTPLQELKESFDRMYGIDADFILSTHYHGFPVPHRVHHNKLMGDVFNEFFSYVVGKPNVQFCSLNELFS